jgi:multicomponent Na+:H+ antiporter subunit C
MTTYLLCFVLFLVGLFGILTKRNIIKIAIGLIIMELSLFMFFALIGYIDNGIAPIIIQKMEKAKFVDPLPQAIVLTAIVIGLATTVMLMAIAIRLYKKYNTFDIRKITTLKG